MKTIKWWALCCLYSPSPLTTFHTASTRTSQETQGSCSVPCLCCFFSSTKSRAAEKKESEKQHSRPPPSGHAGSAKKRLREECSLEEQRFGYTFSSIFHQPAPPLQRQRGEFSQGECVCVPVFFCCCLLSARALNYCTIANETFSIFCLQNRARAHTHAKTSHFFPRRLLLLWFALCCVLFAKQKSILSLQQTLYSIVLCVSFYFLFLSSFNYAW